MGVPPGLSFLLCLSQDVPLEPLAVVILSIQSLGHSDLWSVEWYTCHSLSLIVGLMFFTSNVPFPLPRHSWAMAPPLDQV